MAGDKIKSKSAKLVIIFSDKDSHILIAFSGLLINCAHWTYLELCNPEDKIK
jgi:hypothetical protein